VDTGARHWHTHVFVDMDVTMLILRA
jgi:hypothetical protein